MSQDKKSCLTRAKQLLAAPTSEATQSLSKANAYSTTQLAADAFGQDDWRASARSPKGLPTTIIARDTVVTMNGIQARVSDLVSAGYLRETAPGVFAEPTPGDTPEVPQDAPAVDPDAATMPQEFASAVDGALKPVPDHAISSLTSAAISAAAGDGDIWSLVSQFVSASGVDPSDARSRVQFVLTTYQRQTDSYLNRAGIAPEDLPAFYEAVKANPSQLHDAMRAQANGSMAAWGMLAKSFQANTAPSEAALQANGFQTRNTSGTPEVFVDGFWASISGAARAGMI
jgi:hypothetical protein